MGLKKFVRYQEVSAIRGNLKKIVTFGTKRFVRYSCPLFGMSVIGKFHCIIYVIYCLKYRTFISGKVGEISVFYAVNIYINICCICKTLLMKYMFFT